MLTETQIKREKKELWCNFCDTWRMPEWKRWESSIAIIFDLECSHCHDMIFDRVVETKVKTDDERPEEAKKYQRDYRARVREQVLQLYGGKCVCCGETDLHFLTFDHKNGGGTKERRSTGMTGSTFYLSLLKHRRDDIQVLCFNCNCAKWFYGVCPHENK